MKNIQKIPVGKWIVYPEYQPDLGEDIAVCFGNNNKKEVITWQFKFIGMKTDFKWLRFPSLPIGPSK